jgi:transposase
MARYGEAFKSKVVGRMLPPESAKMGELSQELGISIQTLERWREEAQANPVRGRSWSARGRLEAVITTAALDDTGRNAWCREHGIFPAELAQWCASATAALADPEEIRASPQTTRADRKRIKSLERELHRKDKALAETAALLVLSKKVAAIFNTGEDE